MRLVLCALLVFFSTLGSIALAQCGGDRIGVLTASDGSSGDWFAGSISTSAGWVVVGAQFADAPSTDSGAAYAYRIEQDQWVERKLVASDGGSSDYFGGAVAIDGDVMVVGAWNDGGRGSAYVFRFDGSQWNEEQKLTASDRQSGDQFGFSVGISGNRIAIGAPDDDDFGDRTGSAYVFTHDGSQWNQTQKLLASDAAAEALFGRALAMDGRRIVAGAALDQSKTFQAGAAYVFEFVGGFWVETKLTASDGGSNDQFGTSVDVSGEVVVVGALTSEFGGESGSAYVFRRVAGLWTEEVKLLPPNGTRNHFGRAASVDGDHAVFGAPRDGPSNSNLGAAFSFRHDGSRWIPFEEVAGGGNSGDEFGERVSIGGGLMAVGSTKESPETVRVYAYEDIALEVTPRRPRPGEPLLFESCGGLAGWPVILFTIDVNGAPFFHKVAFGSFGSQGEWVIHTTVPPGLAGLDVTFQSIGYHQPARIGLSTGRLAKFQ